MLLLQDLHRSIRSYYEPASAIVANLQLAIRLALAPFTIFISQRWHLIELINWLHSIVIITKLVSLLHAAVVATTAATIVKVCFFKL